MINPDKRMLLRQLKRIERDLEEGRISREEYSSLKERYTEELETLEAVENIRKLQGQKSPEKPLDHWVEESRRKKDETEKRELMKKYISSGRPEKARDKPLTHRHHNTCPGLLLRHRLRPLLHES